MLVDFPLASLVFAIPYPSDMRRYNADYNAIDGPEFCFF